MIEKTLLLIKPNAVEKRHIGHILTHIEENGFIIENIKVFRFSDELAAQFYIEHWGKDFYQHLIDFMTSDKTVAVVLRKENAVNDLRELIGDTDPHKRRPNTIRSLYAEGVTENAVHASDSLAHAERELSLIFPRQV